MAQERIDDWMEYAREYAKVERELKIEKWVYISIEYRTNTRDRIVLYTYDLPRNLYERRSWVIRWRMARLQCLHPKEDIHPYFSYYDKRTGLRTDFNSLLSKLSAAKAQITIAEKKEKDYLEYQRANNLFFDETTDEQLMLFRQKLQIKRDNHAALEHQIRSMVEINMNR